MAKVYECTFSNINGENTGTFTRVGAGKNYASAGILYKKNCPDNLHFYVDPNSGSNGYYALLNPSQYKGISANSGTVYVWLDLSYLISWKLVDDPTTVVTQQTQPKVVQSVGNVNNSTTTFTNTTGNTRETNVIEPGGRSTIYNSTGETLTDSITNYVSYTTVPKRTTFYNDYSSILNDVNTAENNLNIVMNATQAESIKKKMIIQFNRFKIAYPETALSKTFAHVFFTRPDLNLYSNGTTLVTKVGNDPYFYYMNKNNPDLLKSLTKNFSVKHDFNPFLSNMAESFELSDETVDIEDYGVTYTGWKMKYGKHNVDSKTAGEFSIQYTDDNNYNVYNIHKAWTDYISNVYRGVFDPSDKTIRERVLDYACSVYYFLCGPDGETILFWTKYTGVFPANTPSSASSWQKGNSVKIPNFSIKYAYSWKEDMMPTSLAEFNLNSANQSSYTYAKIYEPTLGSTGKTFVDAPFVETSTGYNNTYSYKLKFRKPS